MRRPPASPLRRARAAGGGPARRVRGLRAAAARRRARTRPRPPGGSGRRRPRRRGPLTDRAGSPRGGRLPVAGALAGLAPGELAAIEGQPPMLAAPDAEERELRR